jgi:DNA-binding winged helix-turn-helix (wHTH) protein
MILRFGSYEFDEDASELRRDGTPVAIQPKPLALLGHLLRERERVVSPGELFELLWPGVAVTPSSLTRAVSVARSAIGDTGRGEIIRSVARRGYRFCADVVVIGAESDARATRAESDPFVGREEALARLQDAFAQAVRGESTLALVTGAPGIGKTRLVERFAADAERQGALVLTGHAREGAGVPALWLWAQVLRGLVAHAGSAEAHAIAMVSSELAELVPDLAPARAAADADSARRTPEQNRFLLFESVARALAATSRKRALVVVLEDLHWAGSGSLRLLEHLVFETERSSLLVVATLRDEPGERGDELERALPILRQSPRSREVALRGFSRAEVARLLELVLGRPAPPDLISALFSRSEGVPLLLREALRLLAERGDLQRPDGVRRWSVSLPTHALDLLRRPLARLSAPCTDLLAAASTLGRDFPIALAAAVAGTSRETALDLLDEAEAAGVVAPAPETAATWRFSHALFQEAVYAGLPAGRRARLHLRAAEELERRHGADLERVIAELAHHHHEALAVGDPERAYTCAVRAAAQATRVYSFEKAAKHWAQAVAALDHAEPAPPERRLAALLEFGDALNLAGERARRRAVFKEAMDAARALDRPFDFARAAIGLCDLSEWAPEDEEGLAGLEAALALLPEVADAERAQLLTRIAYLSARRDPSRADHEARRATQLARAIGDPAVLQDAIYALHFLLAGPDHLDEREALGREAADSAKATVRDATLVTVLDGASDLLMRGDADGARRQRGLAATLAGAAPHLARAWHFTVYDAGVATLEGHLDVAERLIEEAARIGRRIEHPYARGVHRVQSAVLARERGDDARITEIFDTSLPIRQGPMQWVQFFVARTLVELDRRDEARRLYEDLACAGFEKIPRNIRWHGTIIEAANLCADLGDADRAPSLRALLLPVADMHGVMPIAICYGGPVNRCLARLAETAGDGDEALHRYDEALAACTDLGARPARARVQVESGALLLRCGQRQRGRTRLAEGVALAEALGMRSVVSSGRAQLERAKS